PRQLGARHLDGKAMVAFVSGVAHGAHYSGASGGRSRCHGRKCRIPERPTHASRPFLRDPSVPRLPARVRVRGVPAVSYRQGRFWQPDVTVATVVADGDRLLVVEEHSG